MPAIPKSAMLTIKAMKARQARLDAKARKACVEAVWLRARDACEDCGRSVKRSSYYHHEVGHVHEMRARSLGGDPHNPDTCLIVCYFCHYSGPSGAHRRSVRNV